MFCAPVGFQGARGRPGHGQVQPGLRGHWLHGGYTQARGACGCSAPPADRTGVTAVQPPPQEPGMRTSSTEHRRAGTQPCRSDLQIQLARRAATSPLDLLARRAATGPLDLLARRTAPGPLDPLARRAATGRTTFGPTMTARRAPAAPRATVRGTVPG